MGDLSLLSIVYLIIHLCKYGLKSIYFIIYNPTLLNFVLKLFELWRLGALLVGSLSLWNVSVLCVPYFLHSASGLSHVFPSPALKSANFPRSPCFSGGLGIITWTTAEGKGWGHGLGLARFCETSRFWQITRQMSARYQWSVLCSFSCFFGVLESPFHPLHPHSIVLYVPSFSLRFFSLFCFQALRNMDTPA